MHTRLRFAALGLSLAATGSLTVALIAAGCGSSGDDAGYTSVSSASDAGLDIDLAEVFPDSGELPDVHGGPSFGDASDDAAAPPPLGCSGKTGGTGDQVISLTSNGLLRTSLLHVPDGYDPTKGTMLIVNYHGFSSGAAEEILLTGMNAASNAHNFIVAYPWGVGTSWNAGQCCGDAWTGGVDDIQFTKDLLAKLEGDYCIDPKRIYATGMSNGGFMSHRLACEMADTFAAVAPVAGVLGIPDTDCKPSRPIPILDIHGTADPLVPYDGGNPLLNVGIQGTLNFRSVPDTIAFWRKADGCTGTSQVIYQKGDATCEQWSTCLGGEIVLCTIDGGGHCWPGGLPVPFLGKTSTDMSATDTMIAFFEAHPMP